MAKITAQGVVPHTTNEYHEDLFNAHKEIDPDWNLDPSSPDGLLIAVLAEYLGQIDELAVEHYASRDPAQAEDAALDDICAINKIFRLQSAPSECVLQTVADEGTVITEGKQIRNDSNNSLWIVADTVTAPSEIAVYSQEEDLIGVSELDTWTIETPVSGWRSAVNASEIQIGRAKETNDELRARRDASVALASVGLVDSIYSDLAATEGVNQVRVYENTTDEEQNGIPAHGIRVIVEGGEDALIAAAIYNKISIGCAFAGQEVVSHKSEITGNIKDIYFDRPTNVQVFVRIQIFNFESLSDPVIQEIKEGIVAYSLGTLISSGTARFNTDGYQIGENVKAMSLVTAVNASIGTIIEATPGLYVQDIDVSRDQVTYLKSQTIQFDELAVITTDSIEIITPAQEEY